MKLRAMPCRRHMLLCLISRLGHNLLARLHASGFLLLPAYNATVRTREGVVLVAAD
jgi:hypothetical protein